MNNNEFSKQWYHIQDTMNHKLKVEELFIKYINNCITNEGQTINEDSLIHMILKKNIYLYNSDDLVSKILSNTIVIIPIDMKYDTSIEIEILNIIIRKLTKKIINHDNSKIEHIPEFNLYKNVVYKLDGLEYGTKEHTEAKQELDQGFEIHCINNRHHPEHFNSEGIEGMDMYDIIEMIIDWCSAALCRGFKYKLSSLYKRIETHNFSKGLCDILVKNIYLILDEDQIINDLEE